MTTETLPDHIVLSKEDYKALLDVWVLHQIRTGNFTEKDDMSAELITTETIELPDGSWATHGHLLPEIDSREAVVYTDGCRVDPEPDGGWLVTPRNTKEN